MHNRRLRCATPPDRVPPPTTKSRSDDIIDLIEQNLFLSNSMPLFLIMPSLRDFGGSPARLRVMKLLFFLRFVLILGRGIVDLCIHDLLR
jgi:hypothetical protein